MNRVRKFGQFGPGNVDISLACISDMGSMKESGIVGSGWCQYVITSAKCDSIGSIPDPTAMETQYYNIQFWEISTKYGAGWTVWGREHWQGCQELGMWCKLHMPKARGKFTAWRNLLVIAKDPSTLVYYNIWSGQKLQSESIQIRGFACSGGGQQQCGRSQ